MPDPHDPPVRLWSGDDTRRVLRVPGPADDKRSRGTVALRTGSDTFPGAAVLGVEGAWRAGNGYVRYVGPRRAADLVLGRRPETVVTEPAVADDDSARLGVVERGRAQRDRDETPCGGSEHAWAEPVSGIRADAWVIGSGTDAARRDDAETSALRRLLAGTVPVVVDAGALDLLPATAPVIATPHAGEFARLRAGLGLSILDSSTLQDPCSRARAVQETANALGGTVLLKGSTTLIADSCGSVSSADGLDADGTVETAVIRVEAGTPWLATAGTGDVLAGVIGALVAADRAAGAATAPAEVAAAAAWLHGTAGRIASDTREGGPGRPIVALEVAQALPSVIAELLRAGADAGEIDAEKRADDAANDEADPAAIHRHAEEATA